MSQSFLCAACGSKEHPIAVGIVQLLAATHFEAAEFGRITWGIARQPKPWQRTVYINGVAQPVMDLAFYNCDLCFAEIRPGDRCCAQTVWKKGDKVPVDWEAEYMEQKK